MFKKILIANRGARAAGAVATATNCRVAGAAGHAGEFTPGATHV
jgi:acetyl/propionyl-CoA carboxylase alpha subunit